MFYKYFLSLYNDHYWECKGNVFSRVEGSNIENFSIYFTIISDWKPIAAQKQPNYVNLANNWNNETQNNVILHPHKKETIIMELPKDPMMLFSFINMKLRDFYTSLDALCQDMQVS